MPLTHCSVPLGVALQAPDYDTHSRRAAKPLTAHWKAAAQPRGPIKVADLASSGLRWAGFGATLARDLPYLVIKWVVYAYSQSVLALLITSAGGSAPYPGSAAHVLSMTGLPMASRSPWRASPSHICLHGRLTCLVRGLCRICRRLYNVATISREHAGATFLHAGGSPTPRTSSQVRWRAQSRRQRSRLRTSSRPVCRWCLLGSMGSMGSTE